MEKNKTAVFTDRQRTNIFAFIEQPMLVFLCNNMPAWVTPNILSFIGFLGSLGVALGVYFAKYNLAWLLFAVAAFGVQWFGDSLDGRMAYFRNQPRKWWGFVLDMCLDWVSTILMGIGFFNYVPAEYQIFIFTFICLYGWTMILALMKYRVTDKYVIDLGLVGPTELRLIICLILFIEFFVPGLLKYLSVVVTVALFLINLNDLIHILRLADERDIKERSKISA